MGDKYLKVGQKVEIAQKEVRGVVAYVGVTTFAGEYKNTFNHFCCFWQKKRDHFAISIIFVLCSWKMGWCNP